MREGLPRRGVAEEANGIGEAEARHLVAILTRRPDRCSSAKASINTWVPLMWRNSPTLKRLAAPGSGATGDISAALMPFGTTRTMPRGAPTIAS